jgi:hypothetical protein
MTTKIIVSPVLVAAGAPAVTRVEFGDTTKIAVTDNATLDLECETVGYLDLVAAMGKIAAAQGAVPSVYATAYRSIENSLKDAADAVGYIRTHTIISGLVEGQVGVELSYSAIQTNRRITYTVAAADLAVDGKTILAALTGINCRYAIRTDGEDMSALAIDFYTLDADYGNTLCEQISDVLEGKTTLGRVLITHPDSINAVEAYVPASVATLEAVQEKLYSKFTVPVDEQPDWAFEEFAETYRTLVLTAKQAVDIPSIAKALALTTQDLSA